MLRVSRPLRWTPILTVLGLACAPATAATGQVLPIGPDFQVNTNTEGNQSHPVVTVAPDGSFSILWCCAYSAGAPALVGQRFDAGGAPLGGEFVVSDFSASWPTGVGADGAGNFVVVWGEGAAGPGGGSYDYVKGRLMAVDGTPLGPHFEISQPPGGEYVGHGRVAMQPDGGFVVAWSEYGVRGRRWGPGGVPLGGEFQVDDGSGGAVWPAAAAQPSHHSLVTWLARESGSYGIDGRRYDGDGVPVGPIFPIAEWQENVRNHDTATESSGGIMVAWNSYSSGIRGRRFGADGLPLVPDFAISALPPTYWSDVAVAIAPDGDVLVAWTSSESAGSDDSIYSIQARRLTSDGVPLGSQFQVNTYTTASQYHPRVAIAPSGEFVLAWSSDGSAGSDTSGPSVQARRFRPPFFMDGFESGDFSRWSAEEPAGPFEQRPGGNKR